MESKLIPIASDLEALREEFVSLTGLGSDRYRVTPRSPWPSELFSLFAIGRYYGVRTWLESGTYHGQSTEILAKTFPDADLVSVDLNANAIRVASKRLEQISPRVRVLEGDGRDLSSFVEPSKPPVAVFLDGPKGIEAVVAARHLIGTYPAVQFVAIHDLCQSVRGRAVPGRAALEEIGTWEGPYTFWATDDEEYVKWSRGMDKGLYEAHLIETKTGGWRPYEHFTEGQPTFIMRSYGPTVAFLLRANA